jgi:hypothetical protein
LQKSQNVHFSDPLSPNDIWATALAFLGIDPNRAFNDFGGRPVPILSQGEPIRELLPVS